MTSNNLERGVVANVNTADSSDANGSVGRTFTFLQHADGPSSAGTSLESAANPPDSKYAHTRVKRKRTRYVIPSAQRHRYSAHSSPLEVPPTLPSLRQSTNAIHDQTRQQGMQSSVVSSSIIERCRLVPTLLFFLIVPHSVVSPSTHCHLNHEGSIL